MGYLRTRSVEIDGHTFEIRELSYGQFKQVSTLELDAEYALEAVRLGVPSLEGEVIEETLPPRIVARLCREIINLSKPEEDLLGNSGGGPTESSSSD